MKEGNEGRKDGKKKGKEEGKEGDVWVCIPELKISCLMSL